MIAVLPSEMSLREGSCRVALILSSSIFSDLWKISFPLETVWLYQERRYLPQQVFLGFVPWSFMFYHWMAGLWGPVNRSDS